MLPYKAGISVTIGVLARNESGKIGAAIKAIAGQDLLARNSVIDVIVVANGCTDRTATEARKSMTAHLSGRVRRCEVHETEVAGKSRAWNILVHDLASTTSEVFLFMDADVEPVATNVFSQLLDQLTSDASAVACTGKPLKSFARKSSRSSLERFSLAVSEDNRANRSINGQLYCAYGDVLREIWLPVPTPGEDGFLNAMIRTSGFTRPDDPSRVTEADSVTHYYEAPALTRIIRHERRMIVGTAVNIWVFEDLMALRAVSPVGSIIKRRNAEEPGWVARIVSERTAGKSWAVPRQVMFWRLPNYRAIGLLPFLRRLPVGIAATAFNILCCMAANGLLKRREAAGFW